MLKLSKLENLIKFSSFIHFKYLIKMEGGKIALFICLGICCFVAFLLAVILIPVSLKDIEADEYAIRYNHLTNNLDEKNVWTEGKHLLTPESEFFIFKRTLQNLDYIDSDSIKCLSQEGLQMTLSVTTQYQIIKDNVSDVLLDYGFEDKWREYLHSVTRDSLKDVCGKYTADDYFNKRADIEKEMETTLKQFYQDSKAYCTNELVQLRNVAHPTAYVKANQDKQSTEQEKDRLIRVREQELTKETTSLLKAQEDAKIKLIGANGKAQGILEEANTLAPAENQKWEERGDALLNIWQQMSNTTIDQFVDQYLTYSILQGKDKVLSLSTKEAQAHLLSFLDLAKLK